MFDFDSHRVSALVSQCLISVAIPVFMHQVDIGFVVLGGNSTRSSLFLESNSQRRYYSEAREMCS